MGYFSKGELKMKIEGVAKQWIENDPTAGWKKAHRVNKPKLWGKKGCPNRDERGSEQSTNGAANSEEKG